MPSDRDQFDWDRVRAEIERLGRMLDKSGPRSDRQALLRRRAERYRRVEREQRTAKKEVVVFERAGVSYAAPLKRLEEIRRIDRLAVLPGVSPNIAGVINLRDQIVAVHDLAVLRGVDEPITDEPWVVVARYNDGLLGLAADDIEGVRRPAIDSIQSVPLTLSERERCFQGALDDSTVVLDIDGLEQHRDFFEA